MDKVYILSKHPDREVEETIYNMETDRLRIVLYLIGRGYEFDESMDVAVFIGEDKRDSWLKENDTK